MVKINQPQAPKGDRERRSGDRRSGERRARKKRSVQRQRRLRGMALVGFFLTALTGYFYFSSPGKVIVARVVTGPALETVKAVGIVEPVDRQVRAPAQGRVLSIDHVMGTEALEGEPLAIFELARDRKKIVIRASGDGVVRQLFDPKTITDGSLIDPKTPLFAIRICCALRVAAQVSADSMTRLAVGQNAQIRSQAYPSPAIKGKLTALTPMGEKVTDPYKLLVSLPLSAPYEEGGEVAISVVVQHHDRALLVPVSALLNHQVWVVVGNRVFAHLVTVGMVNDTYAQIIFGLERGQSVVVNPSSALREGGRIKVSRTVSTLR